MAARTAQPATGNQPPVPPAAVRSPWNAMVRAASALAALAALVVMIVLAATAWRPQGAGWAQGLWLPWGAVLWAGLGVALAAVPLWPRLRPAPSAAQPAPTDTGAAEHLIEQLRFPALLLDSQARIIAVNSAFSRDCGWHGREWQGLPLHQLLSQGQGAEEAEARWASVLGHGRWQGQVWLRRRDRPPLMSWLAIGTTQPAHAAAGPYIALACDISASRPDTDRLPAPGQIDALTGLPNRRLFVHDLTHAVDKAQRHGRRLAVLQINLDRFRQVNDSLGRNGGDRVLVETARRLRRAVRAEDTVARAGGDQFLVVLEELAGQHDAARLARKIIGVLGEPLQVDGTPWSVSASIGVAMFPDGGIDAAQLMGAADLAMFRAKRHGRSTFAFCASTHAPASGPDALKTQVLPLHGGSPGEAGPGVA